MTFTSFAFLILFGIVFILRLALQHAKSPRLFSFILIAASFVFYCWLIPWYAFILILTSSVDFLSALRIAALPETARRRKMWLILSISLNLLILFFFKYFNFTSNLAHSSLALLGVGYKARFALNLALPLGLSFYTFEAISYCVDVYKKRVAPVRSYVRYILFISFFPHLVAGPIVRAREFIYQIDRRRPLRVKVAQYGVYLMIRGFFSKMVIADNLGPMVDRLWPQAVTPGSGSALSFAAAMLFGIQIYADFDGYTSIARGAAALLGFSLPVNFNSPYIANTFKNFWERWHITLSRWLRDYLYIPLGGNKVNRLQTYINLMLVMVIGGLWHGANATFIIWGTIHGLALVIERACRFNEAHQSKAFKITWYLIVQITVFTAWIFFRSATVSEAMVVVRNMLNGLPQFSATGLNLRLTALICAPVGAAHLRSFLAERFSAWRIQQYERAFWAAAMLYATLTCYGATYGFIYFQF